MTALDTPTIDDGVIANSRLTASIGALLFVALLIEGITILDVNQMFALHAFIGLFLIPVSVLKMGSTGYRFVKYYRKDPAYRLKGPPHPILRIIGPIVIVSTISVLGTGVALLSIGPNNSNSDTLVTFHQASFIVWVSVTTIHVLGHIIETWRLTVDDLRPAKAGRVGRVGVRRSLLLASVVVGLGLGVASLGWNSAWADRVHGPRRAASPSRSPFG